MHGDDAGNAISIAYSSTAANRIRITVNGVQQATIRTRLVDLVALEGGAGNDQFQVDQPSAPFAKPTLMVGWQGDDTFQGGDEADCILAGLEVSGVGGYYVLGGVQGERHREVLR